MTPDTPPPPLKTPLMWQIVPVGLYDLMTDPDEGRRSRGFQAMMQMGKIDLAAMQAAADAG